MAATTQHNAICGRTVQHDPSGRGHSWRHATATDVTADVRQEIEAEIINGGRDTCGHYVASNGLHYRWS